MLYFLLTSLVIVVSDIGCYRLGLHEGRRRAVQDTMRIIRRQTWRR